MSDPPRALKWMDSISSPIAFPLTHIQGDLQPRPGQTKVRDQGSDWVHISMQVQASKCISMNNDLGLWDQNVGAKCTSVPHIHNLYFVCVPRNQCVPL